MILLTFSNCSKTKSYNKAADKEYIEQLYNYDEVYYGLITEYTAGRITQKQDLIIRFNPDVTLKRVFGEVLPPTVFKITPRVKASPYWVDEYTIGLKFSENLQPDVVYTADFVIKDLVDMPDNIDNFSFNFFVKSQNFSVTDKWYVVENDTECAYRFVIEFVNPVEAARTIDMLDKSVRKSYNCSTEQLSANVVALTVAGISRTESAPEILIDGDKLDINKSVEEKLDVFSVNTLKVVSTQTLLDGNSKYVRMDFSNPLNASSNPFSFLQFSKAVEYNSEVNKNSLFIYFTGESAEDADLEITVDPYFYDNNNNKLGASYVYKVEDTDVLPEIQWSDNGMIIPSAEDVSISFKAKGLNAVVLRICRVYNDNILYAIRSNSLYYGVRDVGRLERKIKLDLSSSDYKTWNTYGFVLSDYVEALPGDVFLLTLDFDMSCYAYACDAGDEAESIMDVDETPYWDGIGYDYKHYYYEGDWWVHRNDPCNRSYYNNVDIYKSVSVSNLAVTAKINDLGEADVFVRDISTAAPVNKAKVTIYNYQAQPIAEAKTDYDGKALLNFTMTPYIVSAADDKGNKSYLQLQDNEALSLSKFDVSGKLISNNINGFIYSNRDVWRPGDSLSLNFMLSDKDNAIPANFPVILEVYDPNGRLYEKKINNSPVGNIYSFNFATNAADPTGYWQAAIKIGNNSFAKKLRVETVKPNRLQINMDLPKTVRLTNASSVLLSAKWLNGLKASNLSAVVDATVTPTITSFDNYKDYSFDNDSRSNYSDFLTIFNGDLNAQSSATISLSPLKDLEYTGFAKLSMLVKVFEQSGDFSITSRSTTLSPFKQYVGVRLPEPTSKYGSYYYTDKDWSFDVVIVSDNGSPVKNPATTTYTLYKLENYWWWDNRTDELAKYAKGTYAAPVLKKQISAGQNSFTLNLKDEAWGAYLLVVNNDAGEHFFSKVIYFDTEYGYHHSSQLSDAPALLSLKCDKDEYQVGEKVNISFAANASSKAIVTVESASKILETYVYNNLKDDAVISFTAKDIMTPNVYVYVSLIQPYNSNNDLPIRLYGVAPVTVNNPEAKLNPVISMPKESSSNSQVEISVSEAKGKAMTYTLALVDEGILGLTAYKTADPYSYFYAKQALNIRTWDNYGDVLSATTGLLNPVYAIGGDEGLINPETALSKRFTAVARQLGPFELAAGATKTHKVFIPEYMGSLRVMVIASNKTKNAFGATADNITVKDPLMIVTTAPRVLSPYDNFEISVQTLAPNFVDKDVTVTVKSDVLKVQNNTTLKIHTDSQGETVSTFNLSVPETSGVAKVDVSASVNTTKKSSELQIPVRMPFTPVRNVVTKKIEAGKTETFTVAVEGMTETREGSVTVNKLIPVNLFSRLDYLTSYPHGCLEQMVSKAFPQLYLDKFVEFGQEEIESVKQNVKQAAEEIKYYRRSDNSLTCWKGGSYVDRWTEIYAFHFLIEAINAGYDIPAELLSSLSSYQSNLSGSWRFNPTAIHRDDVVQAYRLFALALNNNPDVSSMNRLKAVEDTMLQPLTKSLLAASYALVGKMNVAKNLLPDIEYTANQNMSDQYVSIGSPMRDLALSIYAEILVGSEDAYIYPYIVSVAEELNSDQWMNTQTTSFALFVLGKYAEKNGVSDASALNTLVTVNGKDNSLITTKASAVVDFVPQDNNVVKVVNNSSNAVYATVYTKSTVAKYETEEKGHGYDMTVKYYSKDGNVINADKLTAGTDFYVKIAVKNINITESVTDNALTYIVPAGWEISNDRLFSDVKVNTGAQFTDLRDDRAYLYFDLAAQEEKVFCLAFNATYKGEYTIPSVYCENMRDGDIYYIVPAKKTVVK
ncbi:MAG: MG2 domain-containing protein [Bacteroidales bacterium]|nr:MG2 domain-containing protein [Bacteroidales bacterium]